ncbi:MAG: hypothetical protein ABSG76_21930 [Xanthobacteraceae bacterium]
MDHDATAFRLPGPWRLVAFPASKLDFVVLDHDFDVTLGWKY